MTAETIVSADTDAFPDVDLFSDEILLDPYPTFARLRESAAVVHIEANDLWALTRYDGIRDALANPEVFSSNKIAFNDQMNEALRGTTLTTDPPAHGPMRAVLSENLSPRSLRKLKGDIDAKADAMVAELVERGRFDAIDDLARALPLHVVADLIGVTGRPRENILRWGEAAFNVLGPANQRTAENFPVAGELFGWAHHVSASDLTEGSMGRAIFDAADRGEIAHETCGMIIHQYVAAGMDTTIASIGNVIALLAAHPDQYELIRQDPSLLSAAYNEGLRLEPPVNTWGRLVKEDVKIEGTVIPAGSRAAILFGSGNRDERHYEDPDTFRVERNPVDHLSFGYGIHGCAGQGLARLEALAVLTALTRRVRRFSVGASSRVVSNMTRSLDKLPVVELEAA
ncbi:cytochrome P450 [Tersicoccus solisilvae]|uniref:Cytochrome P450 n=1 Tax=Tersicoccus solisilvae TaxID=1882339 RepID=A0ABQ1PL79_9MICC|nr:cytochrome P450 [Tersicoccus solisilvae]GGC98917.1 cytochrome P450 [Tersicoccus solisilvae]